MDFNLNEEHQQIRSMVREFAEKKIKPVARKLDEAEMFSYELTEQMGELGLLGIYLPEICVPRLYFPCVSMNVNFHYKVSVFRYCA